MLVSIKNKWEFKVVENYLKLRGCEWDSNYEYSETIRGIGTAWSRIAVTYDSHVNGMTFKEFVKENLSFNITDVCDLTESSVQAVLDELDVVRSESGSITINVNDFLDKFDDNLLMKKTPIDASVLAHVERMGDVINYSGNGVYYFDKEKWSWEYGDEILKYTYTPLESANIRNLTLIEDIHDRIYYLRNDENTGGYTMNAMWGQSCNYPIVTTYEPNHMNTIPLQGLERDISKFYNILGLDRVERKYIYFKFQRRIYDFLEEVDDTVLGKTLENELITVKKSEVELLMSLPQGVQVRDNDLVIIGNEVVKGSEIETDGLIYTYHNRTDYYVNLERVKEVRYDGDNESVLLRTSHDQLFDMRKGQFVDTYTPSHNMVYYEGEAECFVTGEKYFVTKSRAISSNITSNENIANLPTLIPTFSKQQPKVLIDKDTFLINNFVNFCNDFSEVDIKRWLNFEGYSLRCGDKLSNDNKILRMLMFYDLLEEEDKPDSVTLTLKMFGSEEIIKYMKVTNYNNTDTNSRILRKC